MRVGTLRGTRTRVRPLHLSDAPALDDILGDRQVTRMLPTRVRLEGGDRYVRRVLDEQRQGEGFSFVILPIDADEVVGHIRLLDWSRTERRAEVGYWLRRSYWGRGFGTEALGAVCRFGFGRLGLHRIEASVVVGNDRSLRVLEKVGFRREGRNRRSARLSDRWADTWMLGLLRGELRAPRRERTITVAER